jgi:hypothetical protein
VRLLVFGDSLAYFGPTGGLPADEPRLWPNLVASQLGGDAELVAGIGWLTRDAYWALTSDPRVWALLPKVDAVLLAVGSMDTLPSPIPTYLRQGIKHIGPDPVRRQVRAWYQRSQPLLSKALSGKPFALSPRRSVDYLDRLVLALRALRPDLPVVATLPAVHRADSYANVHTGYEPHRTAVLEWATRRTVATVDLAAAVGEHVLTGQGNPDGMHWGWVGHERVAAAFALVLTS